MKKYLFLIITIILLGTSGLVFAQNATATRERPIYLEPTALPGVSANASLGTFLGQVFNWGIAIAVALTVVMIIFGGMQYMTTDSWMGKDEGKTKIMDALIGLSIALLSWIILNTINPCLVNFNGERCRNQLTATTQRTQP